MASTTQFDITLVPEQSFARTYDGHSYDDPWQAVRDYREVVAWADAHPDRGGTAIARMFDLPKGRVEGWLNGSQPQAIRGLETAYRRRWIDADPEGETFRGLNALVAWISQAGSITAETWVPLFSVSSDRDERLATAAGELAGIELDRTRSASALRSRELRPIQDGAVLGRVLVVLGAPQGEAREAGDVTLPDYLASVPERLAREFVQLYIHHLGRNEDDRFYIHLPSNRTREHVETVAELVRRLTGESVSVIDKNIVLSKPATREVAVWDPLLDVE